MDDLALLVIDHPDERAGKRHQFEHMHSWGSRDEMESLKRMLEDLLGSTYHHEVIDGYVCPHCGQTPTGRRAR